MMLSVGEMQSRVQMLQQIQQQGDAAVTLCQIRVRDMPLVTAGEDASEYIPYALHPDVAGQLGLSVRRLREYMLRYIVEGEAVSAHKLPQLDARSRAMMQSMRTSQPQLSTHLLHHWCADDQGAGALRLYLHTNWQKALASELNVPAASRQERQQQWLGAINILLLALLRQEIQRLPDEHAELTDSILVHVLGTAYHGLIAEFVGQLDGDEATRLAVRQRLAAPATPLAFFRRQPKGSVFADAAPMVTAYGLEVELLPRMRQIDEEMPAASAADVLAELASEAMTDHLLKRCWVRLGLRELAEQSGQVTWMRWATDAKKLDTLLSAPAKAAEDMQAVLGSAGEHPFAIWLQKQAGGGQKDDGPWRRDERLLGFFRLFEMDAQLEMERRIAAQRWLNREAQLVGTGRGSEAGRILVEAHAKGRVVLLQKDAKAPLFVAGGEMGQQGVLCIDWSEYLRVVERRLGPSMGRFLEHSFQPGIMQTVKQLEGVFVDGFSASGLVLRGAPAALLSAGAALRELLGKWFDGLEAAEGEGRDEPAIPMCLAATGEWSIARPVEGGLGGRLAFSQGLAQAQSAISRNEGLRRLLLSFDARDGKRLLGAVRIEGIRMADGKSIPILYNSGFVLTGSAVKSLLASPTRLRVQPFRAPEGDTPASLNGFRLPGGRIEGFLLRVVDAGGDEAEGHLLLRIGKVLLGTSVEDIYEIMDENAPGYVPLTQALTRWQAGSDH